MIPDIVKQSIQSGYSTFLQKKGLKARASQRQMIADIARYLFESSRAHEKGTPSERVCVIEAGTGTGKTLAYLSAAIPVAQYLGKNLIVSTATITLQEQLVNKDLPAFRDNSGTEFDFALAKGRGRYLCLAKLETLMAYSEGQDDTADLFGGVQPEGSTAIAPDKLVELFQSFATYAWSGEFDELPEPLESAHRAMLTTDNRSCTNRACSHFSNCPYYKSRHEWDKVDVLVCNHDLVLADLALGGGVILPPPDESIFVFDEAHHLADKALQHFSNHCQLQSTRQWLRQGAKSLTEFTKYLVGRPELQKVVEHASSIGRDLDGHLENMIQWLLSSLEWAVQTDEDAVQTYRFEMGVLSDELVDLCKSLQNQFASLTVQLEKLHVEVKKGLSEEATGSDFSREDAELWYPVLGALYQRAESTSDLWLMMAAIRKDKARPIAKWIRRMVVSDHVEFDVCASPIVADSLLKQGLWQKSYACVLTSATLSTGNNFQSFCFKNGLSDDSFFRILLSPFDYPSVSEIEIPREMAQPTDVDAHTDDVINFVEQLIENATPGRGALILFSSRKQMNDVFFGLGRESRASILRQDDFTKSEVIRLHKEKVDKKDTSVLFGLASFAEGLDLPGDYLVHVVIAKIPFSVPDDPMDAALSEWIESRGGNPFMEITLPQAAIRLKQGCGRLIRTESDSGLVSLLDSRIHSRRYGKYLLDSLPPFKMR